jgi:amino acid transporter
MSSWMGGEEKDQKMAKSQPLLSPLDESTDLDVNVPVSGTATPSQSASTGISGLGLAAIGFFWVSGGSYGNEALVLAAPPGMLFLSITLLGLSYGVPLAVITAEFGTGWPVAGGMGQWVEIAMGEAMGAHNAWWIWVCYVFDGAIYPVLAAQYLAHYTPVSEFQQSLYATGIVFLMTLVKLAGREILEKMATALAILTLMPSLIYWAAALYHGGLSVDYLTSIDGDPCTLLPTEAICTNSSSCTWGGHESWLDAAITHPHEAGSWDSGLVDDGESCGGLNLSLLLSYIMWLYSGFISLGSLAGELADPVRAYWTALLILVPVRKPFVDLNDAGVARDGVLYFRVFNSHSCRCALLVCLWFSTRSGGRGAQLYASHGLDDARPQPKQL